MTSLMSTTLFVVLSAQSSWYCKSQNGWEYCSECPGFSFCLCVDVGYRVCPSQDITCNGRPRFTVGYNWFADFETHCYSACASYAAVGGCYPVTFPCIKDDALGVIGTMTSYFNTGSTCQP